MAEVVIPLRCVEAGGVGAVKHTPWVLQLGASAGT